MISIYGLLIQQHGERGEMVGMKKVIVSLLIIFTLLSLSACVNRVEKYTSPSGNKKLRLNMTLSADPVLFIKATVFGNIPATDLMKRCFSMSNGLTTIL